jgi:hypothetical protein
MSWKFGIDAIFAATTLGDLGVFVLGFGSEGSKKYCLKFFS